MNGIEAANGDPLVGDNDVAIRALLGDANQNLIVDQPDITLLRAHMPETVDGSTFVLDLDLNGTIGMLDGRIVGMNKLHSVP